MFRFANIEMLWCLVAIPVFIVAYVICTNHKHRQLEEFGDAELMASLMPLQIFLGNIYINHYLY